MVKTNKIKPEIELARANPATPKGLIRSSDKITFETREYIEIFAANFCRFLEYSHKEKILDRPKGNNPIRYMDNTCDV